AVSKAFMCRVSTQITGRSAAVNALTSHCEQRTGLDPNPAEAYAQRGQKGDDIGRLSRHWLFQDHLTGIIDNANRRFFHRYIKTHEMRHLIAPFVDARGRTDLDPFIIIEGDARSA